MATRRINGFPKTTTFRLMRLYVCARFRDDGARSATSIASFSVSICRPFEIDDLSDQVKENDSKRRARASSSSSSSSFTHFGLNYSFFFWSSYLKIYDGGRWFWSSHLSTSPPKRLYAKSRRELVVVVVLTTAKYTSSSSSSSSSFHNRGKTERDARTAQVIK
jgi:hypothetical protein